MLVLDKTKDEMIWRPLRLETLVRLRWLAIGGQAAALFAVAVILGFPVPVLPCLILIGLSALFNLWLMARVGVGSRIRSRLAAFQLAYDLLQLGGLLWFTGGIENPFALLLLAPVSVSATTLSQRATILLTVLAAAIATLLVVSHMPLPWQPEHPLQFNTMYLTGIWAALLLGLAFIATYTNRVAHDARQLSDALTATELTLSRQQRLSALDGLAAAAAHELGTPLSTIALAAKEMRSELPTGDLAEDAELIVEQVVRCRAILGKLRSLNDEGANPFDQMSLTELVEELVQPHRKGDKIIRISPRAQMGPEPVLLRNVGLLYGLGNLLENALDFARHTVEIEIGWDSQTLLVSITDDGPGYPADMIARLGEPYLSTRMREAGANPEQAGGLGLGIFIAKTLLERTGATLDFRNARRTGHAQVQVLWPRRAEIIVPAKQ